MTRIYPIKPCLCHSHQGKGELAYKYLKGGCILLRDKSFPEEIGRVPALIDNHTVHLAHEDHELGVYLGHLLEILIMEVEIVVYFLLGEDVLIYLFPVDKAEPLLVL